MRRLKEFLGFIRPGICISTAALVAIGYLLHGRPDGALAYSMLATFFVCAAAYAYNNMTDVREDLINRKRTNYFAGRPAGKAITVFCLLAGSYLALRLPAAAIRAYLSFAALLLSYSLLRIKKYFLLKNIWTAVGVSQGFLIGAFASGTSSGGEYLVVLSLFFTGSIIADMRDVEGDKKTGIETIPVRIGIAHSSFIIYLLSAGTATYILLTGISAFYILLPFVPVMAALVAKGKFVEAHMTGGVAFMLLLALLFYWGL